MNKIAMGVLFMIALVCTPLVFADTDRDKKLEFAGTLEETLGHFWALEKNLDEENSKLAIVHATHPISELYETMSGHLENNAEFDQKLEKVLIELKDKASTDVNRSDAQSAIEDAKQIIQEAREIVVGKELSSEDKFKMQLINGLLETSKVEYKEAVEDGIIKEMAEFQDGSAFVWQSQQIFASMEGTLEPTDTDRINEYYEMVWTGFNNQEEPNVVEDYIDSVIYEFEELSGVQSETSKHEEEVFPIMPPLKQLKDGVAPEEIQCKSTHDLIFKPSGGPACVKTSSIEKLISLGWSQ